MSRKQGYILFWDAHDEFSGSAIRSLRNNQSNSTANTFHMGGKQKTATRKLRTHLVTLLRAVMLATMTLSGLGVATALKVPFQNFSKSCFSSS